MTTKETGLDLEGLRLNPDKVAADIYKSNELIDALLSENARFRSVLEPAEEPEGEEWQELTLLEEQVSDLIASTLSGSNYQPELNLAAHRVVEAVKANFRAAAALADGGA